MVEFRNIIIYIFLFWFCIRICYFVFSFLIVKKRINSFGKKIINLPNRISQKRKLFIFILFDFAFIFLIFFVLFIITKYIVFITGCLFPLMILLKCLLLIFLSRNNGIYEKGIILGMFINFNQISSYKISNSKEVLLFLKNGRSITFTLNEDYENIIDLFEHTIIKNEKLT